MRHFHARPLVAALLSGGLLLTGCENEAGSSRAAADTQLEEYARQLSLVALSAVAESDDSVTNQLTEIARNAGRIEGTDAQKRTGRSLAAAAHRHLAELELARGRAAARDADRVRAAVDVQVRAAGRVAELAGALAGKDEASARALVESAIAETRSLVDEAASALAGLDGPISDNRSLNDADLQQAARLNAQANDLRADARAAGYAAGLPNYREAIELERQADEFEFRVASRQNELSNSLEPQSRLHQTEVEGTQAALDQLRATLTAIGDRERQLSTAAASMQDAVREFRTQVASLLELADPGTAGAHFTAAREHADSARGTRGDAEADIRAQWLIGQALAANAMQHRTHAAVVRAAAAVPSLGVSASDADALEQAASGVAGEADTALAEVEASGGSSQSLASLARRAQQLRASLAATN